MPRESDSHESPAEVDAERQEACAERHRAADAERRPEQYGRSIPSACAAERYWHRCGNSDHWKGPQQLHPRQWTGMDGAQATAQDRRHQHLNEKSSDDRAQGESGPGSQLAERFADLQHESIPVANPSLP